MTSIGAYHNQYGKVNIVWLLKLLFSPDAGRRRDKSRRA